ncbi:MAG TPA: hypothetical protein VF802_02815, partial [Candidatus Limnocylindrales bacterium]
MRRPLTPPTARRPPRRPRPRLAPTLAAVLAASALVLAGCGRTAPTASPTPSAATSAATPAASPSAPASAVPSQDLAPVFAAIEQQVQAIRGLRPTAHVSPTLLDQAGLHDLVVHEFARDNPADRLAAQEALFKHLGLLAPDASLSGLEQEFLTGQVAGLYSPDQKRLYVIARSGGLGPGERVTYA